MFASLTTKLAMRKAGLSSDTFDFSPKPTKDSRVPALDEAEDSNGAGWPAWMSTKKLPLTAQAWLSPVPPPVPVAAECPKPGDLAPLDRDRQLEFGGGRPVIVLFLRCVGCACKYLLPYMYIMPLSASVCITHTSPLSRTEVVSRLARPGQQETRQPAVYRSVAFLSGSDA